MRITTLAAALALLALLVQPVPAAEAHPLPHGDSPRLIDLAPAPGAVVSKGQVPVRAVAAGGALTSHRVLVNGEEVPSKATAGDHAEITTTLTLHPGTYVVEVFASSAAGEGRRAWRFIVSELSVRRVDGDDRVATAREASSRLYGPGEAEAAVVARADDFADALAGVPLAHAKRAPLLLSRSSQLSGVTEGELQRVLPQGAVVYLLGGERALAPAVAARISELGYTVERLAGESRYATAVEIARQLPEPGHAVLASGEDFADALAASSPAAINGWPVLLTRPGSLPDEVRAYLDAAGLHGVHVVGGGGAVSGAVSDEVARYVNGVSRTAGPTRYDTAAAVGARFFDSAEVVGLANGTRFPDALAGGVFAAAHEAPLLLSAQTRVFNPQLVQLGALQPQRAYAFGGHAALAPAALHDLLRAHVDHGGPLVRSVAPTGEVRSLDEVVVEFDRDVDPGRSTVYVTVGGHEVPGSLTTGDFATDLVFTASQVPDLQPGRTYEAQVVVEGNDGTSLRHHEWRFVYRQPFRTLSRGDSGAEVTDLQRRLRDAGYWVGTIDGRYGTLTHHAVLALQKAHGRPRNGAYDEATRALLESNPPRPRPRSGGGSGLVYEIDLDRQILMLVRNGQVEWIFNTSTGHGQVYTFEGSTFRATTTVGRHRVVRQIDGLREAPRGRLWRPKYYDNNRGIAIHGSTSVPEYPASSGCVRLSYAAMDFLWSLDPSTGAGVWVYPENHYG